MTFVRALTMLRTGFAVPATAWPTFALHIVMDRNQINPRFQFGILQIK
jgi:hypothetical protein